MKITCKDGNFLLIDDDRQETLLDMNDLMLNKSRYPMQVLPDGKTGIPKLISKLKQMHGEIIPNKDVFPSYLIDIITTSYLIRTSAPLNVLEIGATSGILSYHLAVLMGKLNRESLLCCVSNVVGNGSENYWLDRISMVTEPPNLSMLVSDYEATQLETENFDIVVLNGTDRFDKPYETVREAQRLVKKNGSVICHIKNAPFWKAALNWSFQNVWSMRFHLWK